MNIKNKYDLAIVIPAYKIDFFDSVLKSLANQTNKNFTIYVGIDASKSDFESIIDTYSNSLDIVFKRFEENLGGKDLVAQWARCIELTNGEPWIWLFSDDDMMESTCVEKFYQEIANGAVYDLYHFDIDAIDEKDNVIFKCRRFPEMLSSIDFYKKKENDDIDCFVVEYIFSRAVYEKTGGFQKFDLAWGADVATWTKFSNEKGIRNIKGGKVYWRKSYANITPNRKREMVNRKFLINVDYYNWINHFFGRNRIAKFNEYVFIRNFVFYSVILTRQQLKEISQKAVSLDIIPSWKPKCLLIILPLVRIAKILKSKIKKKNIQ